MEDGPTKVSNLEFWKERRERMIFKEITVMVKNVPELTQKFRHCKHSI